MMSSLNSGCAEQASLKLPMEAGKNPLVLEVTGNIPPFKNSKVIVAKGRNGQPLPRPFLVTKAEYAKRMKEITESLRLQLIYAYQISGGKTQTGCSLVSWIACSTPADDAWRFIPEIRVTARLCQPGEVEGATVTITRLNP